MKCCICGKEIKDKWGNNPYGALDENGKPIEFRDNDRCCDDCNMKHVIPGRLYLMTKNRKAGK